MSACERIEAFLDEHVDGGLPEAERSEVERHLAGCAACREQERGLRALLAEARSLSRAAAPPPDLWPAVERRIRGAARRAAWTRGLAAAACLLLALAGALSLPRGGEDGQRAATAQEAAVGAALPASLDSAGLEQAELDYARAAEALLAQLRARPGGLPPETLEQVEESLRSIDAALAEVRAAVRRQPEQPQLHLLLASTHRRKVHLLRRAMEVGAWFEERG